VGVNAWHLDWVERPSKVRALPKPDFVRRRSAYWLARRLLERADARKRALGGTMRGKGRTLNRVMEPEVNGDTSPGKRVRVWCKNYTVAVEA